MGVSDRIAVMCQGQITGVVDRDDFDQEKIMEYATAIG
jgi:methyl-galactoside transport system ATP-binding protein